LISLAAFDMDGTLVDVASSWAAVHDYFGDHNEEGLRLFRENKIDDQEFLRRDIQVWWRHRPQLTIDELEAILDTVPLMPGATELFRGLKDAGIVTAIISGGIDLLARRIGRQLGVDYVLANGFRVDSDGRLTGEGIIRVPIWDKEGVLRQVQAQLGISPERTGSVGNSEIDVGLFRRSRIGVAFLPEDDAVKDGATHVVPEKDLRKVLPYLLGPSDG